MILTYISSSDRKFSQKDYPEISDILSQMAIIKYSAFISLGIGVTQLKIKKGCF
jgi:hypothetical protein